jgi:hypothetical protein
MGWGKRTKKEACSTATLCAFLPPQAEETALHKALTTMMLCLSGWDQAAMG